MKITNGKWTQPNSLEFNAIWKDKEFFIKATYFQSDNKPYECNGITIRRAAVPFFVYQDKIYFGKVGATHDRTIERLYPKVINDPSLDMGQHRDGSPRCRNFRNAPPFVLQGRCFVFQIGEDRICFITTWHDNATQELYDKIKKELRADYYFYARDNVLIEI